MKKSEILITDTLFIRPEHERALTDAGYTYVRLEKSAATESELCSAVQGKRAYILGGGEQVTEKVIDAADQLAAIVFTGSGYREFILAHELATRKGIAIANAPGGNAAAVAEYTLALMLLMSRAVLELGRTGQTKFKTTSGLRELTVGIVGLGHVGTVLSIMLRALGLDEVYYYSRSRKYHVESALGVRYLPLEDLLSTADIISLHVSKEAGDNFLGPEHLATVRDGAIIVNAAYPGAIAFDALRQHLATGRVLAAFDAAPSGVFSDLPPHIFFCSNMQTAFNTEDAINTVSAMAVRSLINLLTTGEDLFLVNPEYKRHRQ